MKEAIKIAEKAKEPGTLLGLTPVEIQDFWEGCGPMFEPIVPGGFNAKAFIQMASIVSMSDALRACNALSTLSAAVNAASLGLNLSPQLAEAYLVPRNINVGTKEKPVWKPFCQFVIGFNGYKNIGWRSPVLASFKSGHVVEGDQFEFEYGTNQFIHHKPDKAAGKDAKLTFVYAEAWLTTGRQVFEVMPIWKIEELRLKNPHQSVDRLSGAWVNYSSMARVKVTRPLFRNYLPLTTELSAAIAHDETVGISRLTLRETLENKRAIIDITNPDHVADDAATETKEQRARVLEEIADVLNNIKNRTELRHEYEKNPAWKDDREITAMFNNRRAQLPQIKQP